MRDNPIEPKRVYVPGYRRAAAAMAAMHADLYAAHGIHSGLACGPRATYLRVRAMRRVVEKSRTEPVLLLHCTR